MSCRRVGNRTVCHGTVNRLMGQDGLAMGGGNKYSALASTLLARYPDPLSSKVKNALAKFIDDMSAASKLTNADFALFKGVGTEGNAMVGMNGNALSKIGTPLWGNVSGWTIGASGALQWLTPSMVYNNVESETGVRLRGGSLSTNGSLFGVLSNGNANRIFFKQDGNNLSISYTSGAANTTINGGNEFNPNQYHTGRRVAGVVHYVQNGVSVNTLAQAASAVPTLPMNLGARNLSGVNDQFLTGAELLFAHYGPQGIDDAAYQSMVNTLLNSVGERPIILVILGQSNARGNTLGTEPSVQYRDRIDAKMYNYVSNVFEDVNYDVNGSVDGLNFGIELSFSYAAVAAGHPVLMSKRAESSTGISLWQPGNASGLHADALEGINALKAKITADGLVDPYWVLYWNQGEKDANDGTTQQLYVNRWNAMLAGFEASQVFDKIFVCKTHPDLDPVTYQDLSNVRAAHDQISAEDSRVTIIDMGDYTRGGDGLHFPGPVHEALGVRVFNESNV